MDRRSNNLIKTQEKVQKEREVYQKSRGYFQRIKKSLPNDFLKERTRMMYLKFTNTRVSPSQFLGKGRISKLARCTHSNFNSRYCAFLKQCIKLCAEAPHEIKAYLEVNGTLDISLFSFTFFFSCNVYLFCDIQF
jgi:hypothetical protein